MPIYKYTPILWNMLRKYWKLFGLAVAVALLFSIVVNNIMSPKKMELRVRNPDRSNTTHITKTYSSKETRLELIRKSMLKSDIVPAKTQSITHHATQEVRHIGFLKVHKAASTTMQNMFFRFGLKRNLTFVFTRHPNYFSRELHSHIPLVKPRHRSGYDILCNHGVFDYNVYSSILPNDTVYLGIVRDPLAVFISAVNYYSQPSQLLPHLANVPENKIQNLIRYPARFDRGFFTYTKNSMAHDFGFPPTFEESLIAERLKELDSIFQLVLLVEHIEESLVLMKRYLNWKMQDILFIANNVYDKGSGSSDSHISQSDINLFKTRNSLDYKVYHFFYKRFWLQFEAETDDINSEVLNFKQALKRVYSFCKGDNHLDKDANIGNEENILVIPETKWNDEIKVVYEECSYMTMDEQTFIQHLRRLQGSELPGQKPVLLHRSFMEKNRVHTFG